MNNNARAQLWLEPSGLWWHNIARVGDVDKLAHRNRIESEGSLHLARVNSLLQLAQATNTTYKVDAMRGAQIFDTENFIEYKI